MAHHRTLWHRSLMAHPSPGCAHWEEWRSCGRALWEPRDGSEAGNIGGSATIIASSGGISSGMLYDKEIPLEGPDSVIGRSIIVHGIGYDEGPKRWSARSAQCVIGRARPRTSYKFATPTEALSGVIQSGSQGGTTAPRQPQSSSGTGVLIGYMAKYPSYSGGLVSGVVRTSETHWHLS